MATYAPRPVYYKKDRDAALEVVERAKQSGCAEDIVDLISRLVGVYEIPNQEPHVVKTSAISFEAAEMLIITSGNKHVDKPKKVRAKKSEKADG